MRWHATRLFATYALVSALPIAVLGVMVTRVYLHEMQRHALDQAATTADAIGNAGVEPVFAGLPASYDLSTGAPSCSRARAS